MIQWLTTGIGERIKEECFATKHEAEYLLELDGINDEEVEAYIVAMKNDGEKEQRSMLLYSQRFIVLNNIQ